mgnify:CR=1 FL=1
MLEKLDLIPLIWTFHNTEDTVKLIKFGNYSTDKSVGVWFSLPWISLDGPRFSAFSSLPAFFFFDFCQLTIIGFQEVVF